MESGWGGGGGQGRCKRRIEVFVKIRGVWSGWVGEVRVDVNAILEVGVMWGYGGCEL